MVTKYGEYGSKVEHCSTFLRFVLFHKTFAERSQNGGGFSRCTLTFRFGHDLVRFGDVLLRSATFTFVISPVGIGPYSQTR